ncbi:MAG: hypothetical protein QOJ38_1648 [Solirubrobacterales bacterium]|jgi:hypothetical protein|nr:hypothetical protein [Solirubrobacterales bacterium]
MASGAEPKNLEAISRAIDQHNRGCPFPAAEVRMNPFEAERLGWEEIRGLPIVPDPEVGTGRFRIVCSRDSSAPGREAEEADVLAPTVPAMRPAEETVGAVGQGEGSEVEDVDAEVFEEVLRT